MLQGETPAPYLYGAVRFIPEKYEKTSIEAIQ
jgi:hypothetical protein